MPQSKPITPGETWRHVKGTMNIYVVDVFDEYVVVRYEDYDATFETASIRLAEWNDNYVRVTGDAIVVHYTYIEHGAWAARSATASMIDSSMDHIQIVEYLRNLHPRAKIKTYIVEVG